jgi:hypothetical protein
MGGLPTPRDGEGSLDEADAPPPPPPLYSCVWVGSGIGTPSGEVYWNCCRDVKRIGAPRPKSAYRGVRLLFRTTALSHCLLQFNICCGLQLVVALEDVK